MESVEDDAGAVFITQALVLDAVNAAVGEAKQQHK
jgi:hypothetical protein